MSKTAKIRELNDAFRTSLRGGKTVMTAGVHALPIEMSMGAHSQDAGLRQF